MTEQEATKAVEANEKLRKQLAAVREFIKEYDAHPEHFNAADLEEFKQVLKLLHDKLFK